MKPTTRFDFLSIIAALCIISPTSTALASTVYDWQSWTFPSSQTASANIQNLGSVNLSVQGSTTATTSATVQFENVTFTPTTAPTVTAEKFVQSATDLQFSTQVDFTSLSNTAGLIFGLGNLGTDGGLVYKLTAFDRFGVSMPLTGLTQIGSYDHTFGDSIHYNDDVFLNLSTGILDVTTIPSGDNFNSDIQRF